MEDTPAPSRHTIAGTELTMPVRVRRARQWTAMFAVDAAAAQAMIDYSGLRVARAHNCRLCKSLRERSALEAGASEDLYDDIDDYSHSSALSPAHRAALRYTDALLWTPAQIDGAELLAHYDRDAAVELTFDVLRNSCNKIAVSLGADAARVAEGTEGYRLGPDGLPIYG